MIDMRDRLDTIKDRYEEINNLLMDPEIVKDIKKLTELSKEQRQLQPIVELYNEYVSILESIEDLKEMAHEDDPEIVEMAKMELDELKPRIPEIEDELQILLVPKDPNDEKNVIVEIRGAAGGSEANIFAGDLYRMYIKYAESKRWKIEVTNAEENDAGGFSSRNCPLFWERSHKVPLYWPQTLGYL